MTFLLYPPEQHGIRGIGGKAHDSVHEPGGSACRGHVLLLLSFYHSSQKLLGLDLNQLYDFRFKFDPGPGTPPSPKSFDTLL